MNYLQYSQTINANEEVIYWISHNLTNYLKDNPENQDEIEHILDYMSSKDAPKKLKGMSYKEADSNAKKWTLTQQKKGEHIKETEKDTKMILDFKDGFKIVKLIGENAFKREGYLMRHCVSNYYNKDTEIFSLRDKDNIPHCTMEKNKQIKGKGNGDIHPRYIDYVVQFLKHIGMTVGDNEMKHLGYINISKWRKKLSKETIIKCYGDYIKENEILLDKEGVEFADLELWEVKNLVKIGFNGEIKLQSDLTNFLTVAIKKITSKIFKKLNDNGNHSAQIGSSGDSTQIGSSGNFAKIGSSGNFAKIGSSGNFAQIGSSGNFAQIGSSGDFAQIELNGNNSIGVNAGNNVIVKGKKGNWFCLSEWEDNKPLCVKAIQIDGKIIKEDTWYKLKKGEFVEVNNLD